MNDLAKLNKQIEEAMHALAIAFNVEGDRQRVIFAKASEELGRASAAWLNKPETQRFISAFGAIKVPRHPLRAWRKR